MSLQAVGGSYGVSWVLGGSYRLVESLQDSYQLLKVLRSSSRLVQGSYIDLTAEATRDTWRIL